MDVKDITIQMPDLTYLNNKEWYIYIKDEIPAYIKRRFGKRELIYDSVHELKEVIQDVLLENEYKYDKLWELLQLEWNPLWNVDGTETLTFERNTSGSNQASGTDTTSNDTDVTNNLSERTYDDATMINTGRSVNNTDGEISTTYGRKDVNAGKETYSETKERHGNIGVTKTTELIVDALRVYDDKRMSFIYTVAHDIIVNVAYMC